MFGLSSVCGKTAQHNPCIDCDATTNQLHWSNNYADPEGKYKDTEEKDELEPTTTSDSHLINCIMLT